MFPTLTITSPQLERELAGPGGLEGPTPHFAAGNLRSGR